MAVDRTTPVVTAASQRPGCWWVWQEQVAQGVKQPTCQGTGWLEQAHEHQLFELKSTDVVLALLNSSCNQTKQEIILVNKSALTIIHL